MNTGRSRRRNGILGAVVLILVGIVLLMEKNGVIDRALISHWWPLLLVFIGGWILFVRLGRRDDET